MWSDPVADLILDATINAPKSYSLAAMLARESAAAYEALQDRYTLSNFSAHDLMTTAFRWEVPTVLPLLLRLTDAAPIHCGHPRSLTVPRFSATNGAAQVAQATAASAHSWDD
jgi:hypothetical protein